MRAPRSKLLNSLTKEEIRNLVKNVHTKNYTVCIRDDKEYKINIENNEHNTKNSR